MFRLWATVVVTVTVVPAVEAVEDVMLAIGATIVEDVLLAPREIIVPSEVAVALLLITRPLTVAVPEDIEPVVGLLIVSEPEPTTVITVPAGILEPLIPSPATTLVGIEDKVRVVDALDAETPVSATELFAPPVYIDVSVRSVVIVVFAERPVAEID